MPAHADSSGTSPPESLAARPGEAKQPLPQAPPPFSDILCAVDGSRGSEEAARQAIALGEPGAGLTFIAVHQERGVGLVAQAALSEQRARAALEEAVSLCRKTDIRPRESLLSGAPVSDVLLAEAEAHDLLVLGCHGGSRLGGIMLGSMATLIAHRAVRPVLVARRTVDGVDFPQSVLLATDGSPGSWAAARIATRIARAPRSELRLVYVPDGTHPERYRQVLKQLTVIEEATGFSPRVVDKPGQVADRIGEAARAGQSSLIVIGRRGLSGIRALDSVSERVVHRAPCSVLVVPAEADGR